MSTITTRTQNNAQGNHQNNAQSSATNDTQAVAAYVAKITQRVKVGTSTEHTFRGDLEHLIVALVSDVNVTNEPSNITDCGNPDLLISQKDTNIPIGFIEAKDVGKDLSARLYKEQFDRYKAALDNLIITDYTYFEFYEYGQLIDKVRITRISAKDADYSQSSLFNEDYSDEIERFIELLQKFCNYKGQTIKSAQRLAILMAGKARLLENTLYQALMSDENSNDNTDLRDQFNTFKTVLIHDLTPTDFADIYAQTLAYGMFAARLHDDTLETFSRQEAAELIPKTNPFLRRLFDYVAGVNIDKRIKLTVENLAEVFRATDVAAMLKDFGKTTQTQDPIIHFYETFLAEYNPKLRKQRGVWYTPEPVVQFIVRAVDDILKSEFDLPDGIADTSKIEVEKQTQTPDKRSKSGYKTIKELVHKVQILDPATGTGTFLAAIIQHIFHSQFENMSGVWSSYVEQDLLPRLHGFELLMASYAMAHLKLDMLLTDTGYQPINPKRLQVYLTNSLEEHNADTGTLFAGWLSAEANEANAIKRDAPVMVVIGNPPYAVSSTNKGEWIEGLMTDYKKDLNERNIQPLSDDYIKFIRYGQHYIEKNGEGVLAFITNNSFVDGIVHSQMRKNLMEAFDKVYILNLNGNARNTEKSVNGDKDENVFDIMTGVSINIFIKRKSSNNVSKTKVYYGSLLGSRKDKCSTLNNSNIESLTDLIELSEHTRFSFKSFESNNFSSYAKSFKLDELFDKSSTGVETGDDKNHYSFSKTDLHTSRVVYRPFDIRFCDYRPSILRRAAYANFKNLEPYIDNYFLAVPRQTTTETWTHISVEKGLFDNRAHYSNKGRSSVYPLYIYPETEEDAQNELLNSQETPKRTPNLDPDIVADIAKAIGLTFTPEKQEQCADAKNSFAPIDILDYIYAVLHSPTYRETYKEFLKIDFPRVPYPSDVTTFWQLVALGGELRQIHLLESPQVKAQSKALGLGYPQLGDNTVSRKMTKSSIGFELNDNSETIGKVWINDEQYFSNVPLIAWEFYIGGYQPAQKWLKDRYECMLDHNDVPHYMNIIAALSLTSEIMQRIDTIEVV